MSSEADAAIWLIEYRKLLEVKRELREFIWKREELLFPIAEEHVNGEFHDDALRYCSKCTATTSGSISKGRMYFEWVCKDVYGRCDADSCGWWVPLSVIERELAARLAS
jgi:hypothetical protein